MSDKLLKLVGYKSKIKLWTELVVISVILSSMTTFTIISSGILTYDTFSYNTMLVLLLNILFVLYLVLIPQIMLIYVKVKFKFVNSNISIKDIKRR